jgi:hypothetical protein
MLLNRQPALGIVRALIGLVDLDYRHAMAVLKVFITLDTKFDARCHGPVVPDGCINVLGTKTGHTESLVDSDA